MSPAVAKLQVWIRSIRSTLLRRVLWRAKPSFAYYGPIGPAGEYTADTEHGFLAAMYWGVAARVCTGTPGIRLWPNGVLIDDLVYRNAFPYISCMNALSRHFGLPEFTEAEHLEIRDARNAAGGAPSPRPVFVIVPLRPASDGMVVAEAGLFAVAAILSAFS